jgi:tetratricopeptide (TPR) repeat protein
MNFARGDLERAAFYMNQLGRQTPDDPIYEFFLGYQAFARRDFSTAVTWFKRAYGQRGSFVDALYYIALTYDRAGDSDQAVTYYRYVLQSTAPEAPYYKSRATERLQSLGKS